MPSTENQDTIATLLTQNVQPYSDIDRRHDSTRLIRLNDAKELLRAAARLIDDRTPSIWQLLFANALEASGEAIFAFIGAVKKVVRKAGFFEALASLLFNVDIVLQPVARRFAHFFGQTTAEVVGGPWRKILAYFTPVSTGTLKAEIVDKFFEILHAREVAKLVDSSCVGIVQNIQRSRRWKIHRLLPQASHQRRVRKLVRSRNRGRS